MSRTESTTVQVHPVDEQYMIDVMQRFHWSLLGSQTINATDYIIKGRGEDPTYKYVVSRYVNLQFSRDISLPNLKEIRELETEYFALKKPAIPSLFPWYFLFVWFAWPFYYLLHYRKAKSAAEVAMERFKNRRSEILGEMAAYD